MNFVVLEKQNTLVYLNALQRPCARQTRVRLYFPTQNTTCAEWAMTLYNSREDRRCPSRILRLRDPSRDNRSHRNSKGTGSRFRSIQPPGTRMARG